LPWRFASSQADPRDPVAAMPKPPKKTPEKKAKNTKVIAKAPPIEAGVDAAAKKAYDELSA